MNNTVIKESQMSKVYNFENHKLGHILPKPKQKLVSFVKVNQMRLLVINGISFSLETKLTGNLIAKGQRLFASI